MMKDYDAVESPPGSGTPSTGLPVEGTSTHKQAHLVVSPSTQGMVSGNLHWHANSSHAHLICNQKSR